MTDKTVRVSVDVSSCHDCPYKARHPVLNGCSHPRLPYPRDVTLYLENRAGLTDSCPLNSPQEKSGRYGYMVMGTTHFQIIKRYADSIRVLCTHGGWYGILSFDKSGQPSTFLVEHTGLIRSVDQVSVHFTTISTVDKHDDEKAKQTIGEIKE